MKELESMKDDMDGIMGSLVPKPLSEKIKEGQPITPETLGQASVMALKLSNFNDFSSIIGPVVMVRLLNSLNDVIDNAILEQDLDKLTSQPGTFLLMSGLRQKHATQHATTLTLAALDICKNCGLLLKPISHSEIS